ncbi:efflux RND transporter periplasmic adaptor subunit [Dongia deserti]|uniref:efflux RND transporter periplasmic adaptor subunit n=1 Tax=Dongia deserti TaxID=2268030 RepID=UPI0013C445DD|nr:efflux RND transporter periplasmic adaptor subunit [Dongia deserti]
MRSVLLICVALAAIGGVFVWGKYLRTDPVRAEAAMQQGPQSAPAQNPGQAPEQARDSGKPAIAVKVVQVTQDSMPIRRRTIGWVEPIATVAVKSRINSVIMEQHAQDGQFVEKGDLLFSLDDREVRAAIARDEAAMAQHQAELERARADLERTKTLVSKQTASKQTLDQAMADARVAEAAVAADRAVLQADRLTLSYTTITAPISGRLGSIGVTPGNLVQENGEIAFVTITQMQPIRVTFTLPDRDLDALRTALAQYPPAPVQVFTKGDKIPRAKGSLTFIDSAVDAASGTITAKAKFANDNLALWPGQYFDVEVELGVQAETAIIPTVALQVGQEGMFVYVITPENTAEMRKVAVSVSDGDRSAISSGLQPGERVVVDGQHRLSPGARVMVVK